MTNTDIRGWPPQRRDTAPTRRITPPATTLPLPKPTDRRLAWNEAAIDKAASLGLPIVFRYAKGENESVIETRALRNISVTEAGGHKLVVGVDPDRDGDFRAFRFDRIKGYVNVAAS